MKKIILDSLDPLHLKKVRLKEIVIKKIKLIDSTNINNLFLPIAIETKYFNGSVYKGVLNPIVYFSNKKKGLETDLVMDYIIRDCTNTILTIHNPKRDVFKLEILYAELKPIIEELEITITEDIEGYIYGLSNIQLKKIREFFPHSLPVNSIFVSKINKADFESLHGDFVPHIINVLTGLSIDELKKVKKIRLNRIR